MANFLGNPENIASGWGRAPELHAAPIGELVKSILTNRLLRDKMTQENIADAIKNVQSQRASSAYLDAARQAGVIDQGAMAGVDSPYAASAASNLAKLVLAKKEEDRRALESKTYDTQIGDQTYPLTQDQRVRLAIAAQGARSRADRATEDTYGPKEWDPDLGWVQKGPHGQIKSFPAFTNPNVQVQKDQTQEDKQREAIEKNLGKFYLTPDDLTTEREYGTAQPDPTDKTKTRAKPGTFTPTVAGQGDQPWVRIRTQGGSVVIPRATYEYFHNALHGPQLPPGADPLPTPSPGPQAGASPAPSVAPGAQGGAPVNTPKPGDEDSGYRFKGGDPKDPRNWEPI